MKSAYELAMERFGGDAPLRSYSDEEKEQLAEVDRIYDSRAAQARFDFQARLAETATNPEEKEVVKAQLCDELGRVECRRTAKKDKLRRSFEAESPQDTDGSTCS